MDPVKVFISYARKDESFKDELLEFLAPLQNAGEIKIWHDRTLVVGDAWDEEIVNALNESEIIIFLMSSSFLASEYINKVEILKAMERHKTKEIRIVPIMLRDCDMQSHIIPDYKYKIADFHGLPTNMKPINKWEPRDDGWMDVVRGLKPAIQFVRGHKSK